MFEFIKCIVFLNFIISFSQSHMLEDVQELTEDLLKDYNTLYKPRRNQSEGVVVYLGMEICTIIEFNEVDETLSIMAVMIMSWKDDQLQWNPQKYNGINRIRLRSDQIWTPPLVLINSVEKIEKIGLEQSWQLVFALSTGRLYFTPGLILSSKCDAVVTYYPWDEHNCILTFVVWGYMGYEVVVSPTSNEVGSTYYMGNGAWELTGSEIRNIEHTTEVSLRLKRRPAYVLVNAVCPIVFLSFMSTIVFLIPAASGERVSYSLTILLSIAVFFTIIGDSLPKTSNTLSLFSLYLLVIMVTSIFATLTNVFSLYIYYTDEHVPVRQCWIMLARCLLCRRETKHSKCLVNGIHSAKRPDVYKIQLHDKNAEKDILFARKNADKKEYTEDKWSYVLTGVSNKTNKKDFTDMEFSNTSIENISGNNDISWKDVSAAFDRLLFILNFMIVLLSTIVFAVLIVK